MMNEIQNKVALSSLITIDLEDFYPNGERCFLDIKDFLFQEIILKEKDFREQLKNHNWEQYKNTYIALGCTTNAILPSWAYMLITTYLQPYATQIIIGNLEDLEKEIFNTIIYRLNTKEYMGKKIIIKGCSHKPIPDNAYIQLVVKLQPIVSSLMFGEACSTVPLFKKPK